MEENIQLILSNYEAKYSDLSVYLNDEESEFYIYMGIALLECVSINAEEVGHKMFIGRLYNAGVNLAILRDRFHHDARTVKKWAFALKTSNVEKMAEAFSGRKAQKKVKPELIRYIIQQYNNRKVLGRSYRVKIINGVKEIFSVTLSTTLVSSIFKNNRINKAEKKELNTIEIVDNLGHSELDLSIKNQLSVNQSPILKIDKFNNLNGEMIHHAGLALFELYLSLYPNFQKQIISQILLGAINIEQSKSLCSESLCRFNENIENNLETQRNLLDKYATKENKLDLYKQNATLLSDGPSSGMVFFFDPHTKNYTGMLKVLKGWCGSLHSVSKVINLDALRINAANIFRNIGDDFRVIYDNYRDDHFHLRMLIQCPGLISTNKNKLNIKLWLPGSLQKHVIKKMKLLTDEITKSLNSRNLKIELINGTIHS